MTKQAEKGIISELFKTGAHFGFSKKSRHPSVMPFIFGFKNGTAIINLEETAEALEKASDFVRKLGSERKKIILVGNKNEARSIIKKHAENADLPYVAERWIGGTLTNFPEVKKRVNRLLEIKEQEEKGELSKYTKKERGLIAKEKKDLERYFAGIVGMEKLPAAMFVVDPKLESIAVAEAVKIGIPVVALASSDCDISKVDYPIVANDTQVKSVDLIVKSLTTAYTEGRTSAPEKAVEADNK